MEMFLDGVRILNVQICQFAQLCIHTAPRRFNPGQKSLPPAILSRSLAGAFEDVMML
jgi:hypothetical protein